MQDSRRHEHLAEAIRRHYGSVGRSTPWELLLPLMLAAGLWPRVDQTILITWTMVAMTGPAARMILIRRFRQAAPVSEDVLRWGRHLTWTGLADGLIWGCAGVTFYVPEALPQQVVLLVMIIGISAGSVITTSWWPPVQYAYSVPAVGLTAVALAVRGSAGDLALAGALAVYLAMLYHVARQANRAVMETIALRFENLDLIGLLRREKAIAEQANVAKSRFLAAASHDLRQPLHALGLFVTALNERGRHPGLRGIVENINRCVAALGSLFDTLLDVSRLDAGVVEPKRVHFALRSLLERLALEYEPQGRVKGLIFGIAGGEQVVYSDLALTERILRNLLGNAVRYTSQGGVWIEAHAAGDQVEIAVRDTGPGIPPDKREEVFHEFVQLGNPERDRANGLGLGLAIVRRLVALLDGTVTVEAAAGGGSVFRVRLPRGEPSAVATMMEEVLTLPAKPFVGRVIVVIDDERAVREAMQVLLDGWGCDTVVAEDAAGAAQALRAADLVPDVVIADYRLRDSATGVQAIEQLQAEFGATLPGFIITGDTAPERLQEARASGYLLLHKPVQPGKLRAALTNLRRATPSGRVETKGI